MRILVLANNDIGLYQFRKELIYELLKEHEVYISLPYGKLVDNLVESGCVFIDTAVDRRGLNPIKDLKLLSKYSKILSDIQPDKVITYTIKPNIYGGTACRFKGIDYAENITGLGTAFEKDGFLKRFVITMYRFALRKAAVVFFENTANKQLFVENKIISEHQSCVLSGAGVNTDHYALMNYPENDLFHFLFIGRVMKEKGIEELFQAMDTLCADGYSCCLDVVGPLEENYHSIIEKYENAGWLHYYGYQEDVRPFIKKADCFVLPSWHEGMANTNLECASCGRPVITSNIPGCKEAVIDRISGFVCNIKDPVDLTAKMKNMLNLSISDRKQMGIKGREHVELVFDKKQVVSKTIDRIFE